MSISEEMELSNVKVFKNIMLLFLMVTLTGCSEIVETDSSQYESYVEDVVNSSYLMPDLGDLGDYRKIKTTYYLSSSRAYETISLIVEYEEEEYIKQKEIAVDGLSFLTESKQNEKTGVIYVMEPTFEYNGYTISVVNNEDFIYICNYGMFGYNDETFELVYLYVNSPEICSNKDDSMEEYMDHVFRLD
mgnify:CR=1 FL=1